MFYFVEDVEYFLLGLFVLTLVFGVGTFLYLEEGQGVGVWDG